MSRHRAERFFEIDQDELSQYAVTRAAEIDLTIAAPFRQGVLENLRTLLAHARRVKEALDKLAAAPVEAHEI
jgi:hypothetical protein